MQTALFFDRKNKAGKSDDFTTSFNPPLELKTGKDYQISLISATLWYSWKNITNSNNDFKYYNGTTWKTIAIPRGAYNIVNINEEDKRLMKANGDIDESDDGHPKSYINIIANYNTLHTRIELNNGYKIDFTSPHSLRDILGFNFKIVDENGYHDSDHPVNITNVESLLIHCDLITGSYVNGSSSDVLYSLLPDVPPGYLIKVDPRHEFKVNIGKRGLINHIRFYITNQSGEPVDLDNERVTYYIHLSEIVGGWGNSFI